MKKNIFIGVLALLVTVSCGKKDGSKSGAKDKAQITYVKDDLSSDRLSKYTEYVRISEVPNSDEWLMLFDGIDEGKFKNANGEVVRSIDIKDLKSGVRRISWDGKDDSGKQLPNGAYTVSVNYTGKDGNSYKTQVGSYPVEAVKFVDGKAMIKIAGEYVPMDKISEFYEG